MPQRVQCTARRAMILAFCIAIAAGMTGCWGKKEEPVTPPAPPKAVEKPKVGAVDILKLAPEEAALAAAAPNPQKLYERALKLAKRLSGKDADIDAAVKQAVDTAAAKFKVTPAASFAEIARAKGIDPEAPLGVFLDPTPTLEGLRKKAAEPAPLSTPQEEPVTPVPDEKTNADGSPSESQESFGGDTAPQEPASPIQDAVPPSFAVVVSCSDAKLAEQFVREVAAEVRGASAAEPKEADLDGVRLVTYEPNTFSYFFVDRTLVMGNSVDLLKGVAGRFKKPAEVRYGSEKFPANDDDQIVQLVRLDRMKSIVDGIMPLTQGLPGGMMAAAALQNQETLNALSGKDPLVVTVSLNDEKLEILTRLDTETHPDLAKVAGSAQPLRLAAFMPESTVALLCMRFNAETKATMGKAMSSSMGAGATDDPGVAGAMGAGSMVLDMIGDEIVIGVTGVANGMPKLAALAALANPEQTQGFLKQSGVKMEGEGYSGVEIMQVPVVFATLYYAFVDKTLAASNDLDQLKSSIDTVKSGTKSNLFQSLKPALDPAVPRYGAFLVRDKVVEDVLKPLMLQFPTAAPPDASQTAERVSSVIRELRITQDLNGNVEERHLTAFLN